jgi:hypothetical protein
MLQNLSPDVRECLRRAEDCAARAKRETNTELQREFFEMEMRWLKLARSFQFAEQLRTFTIHREGEADRDRDLTARLNSLKRILDGGENGSAPN